MVAGRMGKNSLKHIVPIVVLTEQHLQIQDGSAQNNKCKWKDFIVEDLRYDSANSLTYYDT